ncbi:4'-phosphopantetheinyl transferase family protein [Clostridium paraputrificum]|uniref:4'-phosphopantetheinyl transferase family protein n=1 Tax=Clostridium TaxID=1485 RepID=UPI003D32CBC3
MNKIFIIKTLDVEDEKLNKICEYICCEKRTRVNKLFNKKDKIQTLIAEILIRGHLIENYNMKNEAIFFEKNSYGKPYVKTVENFHYNISHSGEFVVVAISEYEIGIDIEEIKGIEYIDIAKNFFTNNELEYITSVNDGRGLERFYDIWTLKEAYIKFKGIGLSIPLNSFAISFYKDNSITVNEEFYCAKYLLNQINIIPGYKLSICKTNNESLEVKKLNQNELINHFFELIEKENI